MQYAPVDWYLWWLLC